MGLLGYNGKMLSNLWHTVFYEPLYNALVFLIDHIPGGNVGLAVIVLTIIVKLILFPLAQKSIISQAKLKSLEPEIERIKKQYADNKEEQARKTFELYKINNVNPFSGCLLVLVQLPIIFALYYVFLKGLNSETFGTHLYSFVSAPSVIGLTFLGINMAAKKSIILALLAGASQFFQIKLSVKPPTALPDDKSFKTELAKSMHLNMRFVLPVIIAVIAYQVSAAVALYWVTSNLFMIVQELYVKHRKLRVVTA